MDTKLNIHGPSLQGKIQDLSQDQAKNPNLGELIDGIKTNIPKLAKGIASKDLGLLDQAGEKLPHTTILAQMRDMRREANSLLKMA